MNRIPSGYEGDLAGWLFPILMLALFAGLMVALIRSLRRQPALSARSPDPPALTPPTRPRCGSLKAR